MSVNLGGCVLHKILSEPSSEHSMAAWAKVKVAFFGTEYISIYSTISSYYDKRGFLPSFDDLDISLRDGLLKNNLKALRKLDLPEDVDINLVVDSLIDEYTQIETLKQIENLIDNITLLDTEEIKGEISNIQMYLEEKTHTSETVCLMTDITLAEDSELQLTNIALGINNNFDAEIKAMTSDLIMLGGKRGSGKSIVSTNIFVEQYLQGNSSLYFSIEMPKREQFNRLLSVLAGVEFSKIRNSKLEQSDYDKLALARKDMFLDSEDTHAEYLEHRNYNKLEQELIRKKKLKPDNQMVIIDNQNLTLADIDLNIQKFKAQFKDKLKLVVVDYVNQIEIKDIYNWSQQIVLSKQLKNLARKYDICMVTPYQIDASGEARFSKGILDAADMAMILHAEKDHIKFESTKTRSTVAFELLSGINWPTLQIDSKEFVLVEDTEDDYEDKKKTKVPKNNKTEDMPF